MVEVHHEPHRALSDGPQAILPADFAVLVKNVRAVASLFGRD
jgi:3-deoxy-7-phosphoheptulonate synthase